MPGKIQMLRVHGERFVPFLTVQPNDLALNECHDDKKKRSPSRMLRED